MKRVVVSGILLVVLISCAGMKTFKGTADLHGSVFDVKNRPVANCTIFINEKEKALTDSNGRFILYGLKSGVYQIEAQSSYTETYTGEIQFLNETQYALITVVDADTLYESIETAFEKSDYSKAEEEITRLLTINKTNPNAVMYMAVLRYKEKNSEAALRILRDAESRGISDIWMKKFIEKLEAEDEKNS